MKNGTLLVLLSAINGVQDGCFGAVSTGISKVLLSCRRKRGVLLRRSDIERVLSLLSMVGYESMKRRVILSHLCKTLHQLTQPEGLLKICERGELCVSNGPPFLLI
jgi:hypothetical protein